MVAEQCAACVKGKKGSGRESYAKKGFFLVWLMGVFGADRAMQRTGYLLLSMGLCINASRCDGHAQV